jgi:hypothetical protein
MYTESTTMAISPYSKAFFYYYFKYHLYFLFVKIDDRLKLWTIFMFIWIILLLLHAIIQS